MREGNEEKYFPRCEYTGRRVFKKLGLDPDGTINFVWFIREDGNVMRVRKPRRDELKSLAHTTAVGWRPDDFEPLPTTATTAVRKRERKPRP